MRACGGTSVLNRVCEVRSAGNDADLKFLALTITKQLSTDDKMISGGHGPTREWGNDTTQAGHDMLAQVHVGIGSLTLEHVFG